MTTIIAFAGRKQSGKTTCAQFIEHIFNNFGTSQIYNFADPLKQDICMNMLGLTYEQCYGNDAKKNEYTDIRWEDVPGYTEYWSEYEGYMTAREVMQVVGTDIFRKMKNDIWASATIKKIIKDNLHFAIIADCRFPNEVDAVKNAGGFVIKLSRNPHNSCHASEVALDIDNYDQNNFDLIIDNETMTIVEQNNAILKFLKHKGMILS
jgi:hypothetical protein